MTRPTLHKILVTGGSRERLIQRLQETFPQIVIASAESPDDVTREIADTQVLIGGSLKQEQLAAAQELVWHHVPWVGVEGVIQPTYAERDILLTNGSGVNSANIAEHVIAMMLAFARDLPRFVRDQADHAWRHWDSESPHFFELGGQRVLCLGTGDIGQEVARRLAAFDCDVVGASRSGRQQPGFRRCVDFAHLDDELAQADHVVNSLPMTSGTDKIVGHDMIATMKTGAYFYNVGRGGTVDQHALVEALQSGHLAGAGLDVVSPEPLPPGDPLWDLRNVIITSHTSGNSPVAQQRMEDLTIDQLHRFVAGEHLLNIVDLTAGY